MPVQYLTRKGIAELIGVKVTTVHGYDEKGLLPEPDVMVGHVKGWSEETIRRWHAARPGRGHRSDRLGSPTRSAPSPRYAGDTTANTEPNTDAVTTPATD